MKIIPNIYRTHTCGELTAQNAGQTVTLSGWLYNIRDKGSIMFITLRDHYGVTQAVISDDTMMNEIRDIPRESTVKLTGEVVVRSDINPNMPTGEVEIIPQNITVLGRCTELLPFEISTSLEAREDARLKYRFLDLRNEKIHNNIMFRAEIIKYIRDTMTDFGFLEIQTPILTSSSPEGARDFIVPSRLHPGEFYALPQAPQQFKQLLMVSGFDKYFQVAPCFRDEDPRADRSPGEFYQLDVEMSFATQEDVLAMTEKLLHGVFTKFSKLKVSETPFERIKYADAIKKYGSDKPDLRNPLVLSDVTEAFAETDFQAFRGKTIVAIAARDCGSKPRSFFDGLNERLMQEGGRLAWLKVGVDGLTGSISKFVTPELSAKLLSLCGAKLGDGIFMIAGEDADLYKHCGLLRNELGKVLSLINQDEYKFCWIVDFPMYELDDDGKPAFSHNPFSMPQGGMDDLLNKNPLDIYAYQYDLTCNGYELASGAVRNHEPEIMVKAFDIAGYPASVVENKFPALFNAFKFGAPPHAGIAPGIDRIVMLLAREPNIREVIAFPKNKNAQDLLMGAPSAVTQKQLDDVHIMLKPDKEDK